MKRYNLYLPEPLMDVLRKIAKRRDMSVSEIVRQVLQEYLEMEYRISPTSLEKKK